MSKTAGTRATSAADSTNSPTNGSPPSSQISSSDFSTIANLSAARKISTELTGPIKHTAATTHNGKKPSRFVLVSPTAFQNLSPLQGLQGPIKVNGTHYPGVVPMTPFKMLSDEEISAVLTFVRNTFGNKAPVITPTSVKKVREETKSQPGFYSAADLLKEHPE